MTTPRQDPQQSNAAGEWTPRIGPSLEADSFHLGGPGPASGKKGGTHTAVLVCTAVVIAVGLAIGGVVLATSSKPASSTSLAHSTNHAKSTKPNSNPEQNPPTIPNPPLPMSALRLVGGPVASDGRLLVINVAASRLLQLSAINPVTETVVWQRPYSASGVTPGEPFPPLAFGDIAIDLTPIGGARSANVQVLGVDVATGAVVWTYRETGETGDAPVVCAGPQTFCLSWGSESTEGIIEVDATNGSLLRVVPNVERNLGENIYQANVTAPTLLQIGNRGQLLWQEPAESIFGVTNYNPDSGWDIDPLGSLDVGSVGPAVVPKTTYDIGTATTTGFTIATGQPVWTDPGLYNCEGPLEIFSTPTICRFTGTITMTSSGGTRETGVTVRLEGFDTQTGRVTWSQADQNITPLVGPTGAIPFLDGNHIVIKQGGTDVVLDLATGGTRPVASGAVFWCATIPTVQVLAPTVTGFPNERAGTDQFFGCNAAGVAVSGHPSDEPPIVGVFLDGKFFWPSPHGLEEATEG